ncbi:hypothetical protein YC2023_041326 [Brassica napus]
MAGDVGETNDKFFKHEHESQFGEEKESKEKKDKPLKEIEMGNAAYKATVKSDTKTHSCWYHWQLHSDLTKDHDHVLYILGTISSYQSKATFVAYKQCSGNKMDKVNEILSLAYIDILASHLMYQKLDVPIPLWKKL